MLVVRSIPQERRKRDKKKIDSERMKDGHKRIKIKWIDEDGMNTIAWTENGKSRRIERQKKKSKKGELKKMQKRVFKRQSDENRK